MAGGLVGVAEDVLQRWVGGEDVRIEGAGDGEAVILEDGHGGFDYGGLLGVEWHS